MSVDLKFSEVETPKEAKKSTKVKGFSIKNCTITGVIAGKTQTGNDLIEVGFVTSDGLEHTERMSLSGGAVKYTLQKLSTLASKIVAAEEVSKDMSVEQLNRLLTGKKVRIKFSAEEYVGTDGNTYTKAVIGLFGFCESIDVPMEETKLVLDKDSKWDYKRLPSSSTAGTSTSKSNVDDLPF
jgi:hypothetical protein